MWIVWCLLPRKAFLLVMSPWKIFSASAAVETVWSLLSSPSLCIYLYETVFWSVFVIVSMILSPTYTYALPQSAPVLSSVALNVLSPSKDVPRIVNASLTVRIPQQPVRWDALWQWMNALRRSNSYLFQVYSVYFSDSYQRMGDILLVLHILCFRSLPHKLLPVPASG